MSKGIGEGDEEGVLEQAGLSATNGRGAHEMSWRATAPGIGGHGCGVPRESQSSIRHTIWSASM
jgi:hypothetical protein